MPMKMVVMAVLLSGAAAVAAGAETGTRKVFRVDDFGARPDSAEDNTAAIRKALDAAGAEEGPTEVVFSAGTYRLRSDEPPESVYVFRHCLPLSGVKDMTVRGAPGKKTKLLVTNPANGVFRLQNCDGMVFRDFVVDYDPLPFTQGRLLAVDKDKHTYDVLLDEGYAPLDAPQFKGKRISPMVVWDPAVAPDLPPGEVVIRNDSEPVALGGRKWRMTSAGHWMKGYDPAAKVDDPLHSPYIRPNAAVVLALRGGGHVFTLGSCNGVEIRGITAYTAPGFLVLGMMGSDLAIAECVVAPPEDSGRLRTCCADGIHVKNIRGEFRVENCRIENAGDDCVNFHSTGMYVEKVESDRELLVDALGWSGTVMKGDRLQIIDQKTGLRAELPVREVETIKGGKYRLTFAEPVAGVKAGERREADLLFNLDCAPSKFAIRNNRFTSQTGLIARGTNGVIEGNVFVSTSIKQALTSGYSGFPWFEGPIPRAMRITGNTFEGGRYCQIELRGVSDIRIENNRFLDLTGAAMILRDARGMEIRDNVIVGERKVYTGAKPYGLVDILGKSADIRIDGLKVDDPREVVRQVVRIGPETTGVVARNVEVSEGRKAILDESASR